MLTEIHSKRSVLRAMEQADVAIVDQDEAVREKLRDWINSGPRCRCACACVTAQEAWKKVTRLRPAVVLMEAHLLGESGILFAARLKERLPEVRIIMLSSSQEPETISGALSSGADGYLLKPSCRREVLEAIAEVRAGGAPLSRLVARRVLEMFRNWPNGEGQGSGSIPVRTIPFEPPISRPFDTPFCSMQVGRDDGSILRLPGEAQVTPREWDVLQLLARGLPNKRIAAELGISYETACVHLRRIYKKLRVQSRTEAVLKYLAREPDGSMAHRPGHPRVSVVV